METFFLKGKDYFSFWKLFVFALCSSTMHVPFFLLVFTENHTLKGTYIFIWR